MKSDISKFFNIQRQIFGVCPRTGELFRLSDCRIYSGQKPRKDWLDKLVLKEEKLADREERLDAKAEAMREAAREIGRKAADRAAKKVDPIFTPRKLDPNDSKVIFHPIDYIVFNGMSKKDNIRNLVLLDRQAQDAGHKRLQKSIDKAVEKGNYEWQTMRVKDDGKIEVK